MHKYLSLWKSSFVYSLWLLVWFFTMSSESVWTKIWIRIDYYPTKSSGGRCRSVQVLSGRVDTVSDGTLIQVPLGTFIHRPPELRPVVWHRDTSSGKVVVRIDLWVSEPPLFRPHGVVLTSSSNTSSEKGEPLTQCVVSSPTGVFLKDNHKDPIMKIIMR